MKAYEVFININYMKGMNANLQSIMLSNQYSLPKVICLFLLIVSTHTAFTCSGIANLTYQQLWPLFAFTNFQIYYTYIVAILAIAVLAISLATWVFFPHFSIPSNIIFVIIAGSLVDLVCHLVLVSYYKILRNGPQPSSFSGVCSGIGFISLLGNLTALYYNTLFCIALAYSINNTLRRPFFSNFNMNIICVACILIAFIVIVVTQNPKNIFKGICLYRQANQASLTLLFLHLIILFAALFSLIKFKQKIPKNTYFKLSSHFFYYYIYMIIFSVIQGINVLLFMIGYFQCKVKGQSNSILNFLDTLAIIIQSIYILQAFAIAFLRIGHPKLIQRVKQRLNKGQAIQHHDEKEWIVSLVQSIKGSQILSFIQAIVFNYIQHSSRYPRQLTPYHFQRQYNFLLNQSIAEDYVRRRITNRQSHFDRQDNASLKTLNYQVTTFTPEYFAQLYRSQKIQLFTSFDIRKNISLVKDGSYTNSGKSGQFFFGTHDHKFIIKTVQAYELQLYRRNLYTFHEYYKQNPKNLLVKILGLYKFMRSDIKQSAIFLILMKNLTQLKKDMNIRTYDIKGSQFNRSTLTKTIPENEQQLRKIVMLDNDFLIVQQKLHLNEKDSREVKHILQRDLDFLAEIGVMDYSVLIIKRSGPQTNQIGQYQSTKEPGIFYHIGIIDYLEEWTFRRKAQRLFKTLITNREVTVNSPKNYSKRLIEFINTIL